MHLYKLCYNTKKRRYRFMKDIKIACGVFETLIDV